MYDNSANVINLSLLQKSLQTSNPYHPSNISDLVQKSMHTKHTNAYEMHTNRKEKYGGI